MTKYIAKRDIKAGDLVAEDDLGEEIDVRAHVIKAAYENDGRTPTATVTLVCELPRATARRLTGRMETVTLKIVI